jgi:flagellar biosynthesis/type III secretory pathway protein FliH
MTRVLKKNAGMDSLAVHSLVSALSAANGAPAAPAAPAVDPEILALRAERDELKHRVEQQEAKLSDLRAEAETAFQKGEAKGRDAGLREAADQGEQRLARLEAGIAKAQTAFVEAMAALERLAPALAHDALANLLGPADERPQLVAAIVRKQVQTLDARSLIHVEVSAADFPDDDALAALEGALGRLGPSIHASIALKSGECRIKQTLGTLDVGIDRQWAELSALLRNMADGEGAGS